ncbi:CCA tRNA nucleotidyltransferase [Halalkalibacterium halodurans]|uniref:CCA tRNA nucleotidyltransferase n=1 Tax=Halalkalibacterium halodurans TaxID=86665 RepID=UPI001068B202|nr:CCA tRNA nucleotidyltransferase [Halalkalibacterium halodurans]TES54803.1 CCA tRNA nucleotidyltransferase [Halalkalibacterium halodurans]
MSEEHQESYHSDNLIDLMNHTLTNDHLQLLKKLGEMAAKLRMNLFLVGGTVRDMLRGVPGGDLDLVIEGDALAFSQNVANVLGGKVKHHEPFATATWVGAENLKLDIVSARAESYAKPAALPTIRHSHITDDLARRDFSINAMAIHLHPASYGQLVDPFHGRHDLTNGLIRILHSQSFIDDPTRLFRGVRFVSRFNYRFEQKTANLALATQPALTNALANVSPERIVHELKLLCHETDPVSSFSKLEDLHVWQALLGLTFSSSSATHLSRLQEEQNGEPLHWFQAIATVGFLEDNWKASLVPFAITAMEQRFLQNIEDIQKRLTNMTRFSTDYLHKQLYQVPEEPLRFYALSSGEEMQKVLDLYLHQRKQLQPLLTGHDLMELGMKPSPLFKECLLLHECEQLKGTIENKQDALQFAREFFNQKQRL